MKVTAEQYGDICDVIARVEFGWPPRDERDILRHTSDVAREATNRILDILVLDIEDPREISR